LKDGAPFLPIICRDSLQPFYRSRALETSTFISQRVTAIPESPFGRVPSFRPSFSLRDSVETQCSLILGLTPLSPTLPLKCCLRFISWHAGGSGSGPGPRPSVSFPFHVTRNQASARKAHPWARHDVPDKGSFSTQE